jgi:hypothetical protein
MIMWRIYREYGDWRVEVFINLKSWMIGLGFGNGDIFTGAHAVIHIGPVGFIVWREK